MNRFVRYWRWRKDHNDQKDERGFSLVELIASLTLISVVLSVIYASITFGMNTFNKVRIENSLRDEGDIIMSSIITKLYQYGPDSITQQKSDVLKQKLTLLLDGVSSGDTMEFKQNANGKGQLFFNNELQDLQSSIVISDNQVPKSYMKLICTDNGTECKSGLIEVKLRLEQSYGGKIFDLDLESRFGF